jgi:hypothetical protein
MKIPVYTQGPSRLFLRCAWLIEKTGGGTNVGASGGEEQKVAIRRGGHMGRGGGITSSKKLVGSLL